MEMSGRDMTTNDTGSDLDPSRVAAVFGDRPVRAFPALLSTEATAMAWAREGAPSGGLVVADYQAAPRGRGGLPWHVHPRRGLGFTLLARPDLPPEREGWPYVAALMGLYDALGEDTCGLTWPDTVHAADASAVAQLGVYVELGPSRSEWVTVTVLVQDTPPPRGPMLLRAVDAVERRLAEPAEQVLADYLPQCTTLGQQLRARLIPLGPGGPEVTGEAVDVLPDGALVLLTQKGNRVAIPPHNLGFLEPPQHPVEPPPQVFGRPHRD